MVSDNQQETNWFLGFLHGCYHQVGSRILITCTDACLIGASESSLRAHGVEFQTHADAKKTRGGRRVQRLYVESADLIKFGSSETIRNTADVNWLVGAWQAAGDIRMCSWHPRGDLSIKLEMDLTHEDVTFTRKVISVLSELNQSHYVKEFTPTRKMPYVAVTISGLKRCQRFLTTTRGLWVGKRDSRRTGLMLDFIESRLSKPLAESYDVREQEIYNQMKLLTDSW